jgi:hypothetical protein
MACQKANRNAFDSSDIVDVAYRTPPCPREGLSLPVMNVSYNSTTHLLFRP